jgi:MarR family transcriptional regulator, organic hydroperoxide resistance regulator
LLPWNADIAGHRAHVLERETSVANRPHLDLGSYLPYLVNRVGSALADNFTRHALVRHGLTIAMWRVLAALSHNGEQRLIDLAGTTSIDVSTLSRLVTRLVQGGLVSRERSRTSNREILIALTAKGRGVVDRLIPIAHDLDRTAGAGIPAKDLAVLKRSLRRVFDNLSGSKARPRRDRAAQADRAVTAARAD